MLIAQGSILGVSGYAAKSAWRKANESGQKIMHTGCKDLPVQKQL